jgi:PAS domain S-box-containing protein
VEETMPKILVIDDKKDNLITVSAILKIFIPECKVVTALSGAEGLRSAKSESPDVILLDIIMPGMDGFETCWRLKKDKTIKHIPVILVTAIKADTEIRVKGLELGADAFLSKPIDQAELAAQVKVMLRIKNAEDLLREEKKTLEDEVSKRTEQRSASERHNRMLVETMNDGLGIVNKEGMITYVNEKLCEMWSYTAIEIIGRPLTDFLDDANQSILNEQTKKRKKGRRGSYEISWRMKTGQEVHTIVSSAPIFDFAGNYNGNFAVITDITTRKHAEEEIRQKANDISLINDMNQAANRGDSIDKICDMVRNNTRRMFNSLGTIFYNIDSDGHHLSLNKREIRPLKIIERIEKIIGSKIPSHIKIRLKKGSIYEEVIRTRKSKLINDARMIKKLMVSYTENQVLIELISQIYKILDIHSVIIVPLVSANKIIGMMNISRATPFDESHLKRIEYIASHLAGIMERRKAEQSLSENEEKFRHLIETSPFGIVVHRDNKIIYTNPGFIKIAKAVSVTDIIGRTMTSFVQQEQKTLAKKRINTVTMERKPTPLSQSVMKCIDRSTVDITINSVSIAYYGQPATYSIINDVSERMKMEMELEKYRQNLEKLVDERTSELEKKNEELERFNQLFIGREFRIKELRDKVKELEKLIQ